MYILGGKGFIMNLLEIRNFKQEDMPLLGDFYHTVTHEKKVVFWWVGSEENWENVFCAYEDNKMIAKGQVEIINIIQEGRSEDGKHLIYLNLKTLPERETDYYLLNQLYDKLYERALVLKQSLSPIYSTYLCVGNFGTEIQNNTYFTKEKGFKTLNTLYTMTRDLNEPIIEAKLLNSKLHVEFWDMSSTEEEKEYLEVEDEIWPDSALGLNRLQNYKSNNYWTAITVRDGQTLVGSAMAWQEDIGVIEDVFVRTPWRNQGIAKFLLTTGLTYLKNNFIDTARLMVDTKNENALNLYHSVGFVVTEEEQRFYTIL
jgi:ribosomal protein S18 acetylase RimI-like enzyme